MFTVCIHIWFCIANANPPKSTNEKGLNSGENR